MLKQSLACLLVIVASVPSRADNCDSIRDQIEAKYRAGGIANFTVQVVDAGAVANAKVVGSCGNGARRIIFAAGNAPGEAAAPPSRAAATPEKPILTECKDGSVSQTGNCKKP